ncbi:MAG: alpha/beta hydrolase [Burkholderiales bacterium]
MKNLLAPVLLLAACCAAHAQSPQVVDLPTRPGVTQRILAIAPEKPQAAVVLFAGGNGGIGIKPDGSITRGGNFLVRSRKHFAGHNLLTVVIDAPSDRDSVPRETAEHVTDIRAVIAWVRQQAKVPVWLVGTSRGTQSAAYVSTKLPQAEGGPDGVVLTSSMVEDRRGTAVPDMDIDRLRIPVLVVHHKQDGCRYCLFSGVPRLMDRLAAAPRKELIAIEGGNDVGDPCRGRAFHGYNGIEPEVVGKIAKWITTP